MFQFSSFCRTLMYNQNFNVSMTKNHSFTINITAFVSGNSDIKWSSNTIKFQTIKTRL